MKASSFEFFAEELKSYQAGLEAFTGRKITEDDLANAIKLHNRYRDRVRAIYEFRKTAPPKVSGLELMKILTVGTSLPVEEAIALFDQIIARIHRGGEGDSGPTAGEGNLTQIGTIMGSPAYMSPEQAVGTKTDHRTDIFSLGIVMYEALTGEKPFKGRTIPDHITSILKDQPADVASIKPGILYLLAHIIGKVLQKDLRKRYQTVQDIVNDLRAAKHAFENQQITGDSNGVNSTGANRSHRERTPGFRLQMLLGVCFILVGVMFGWFLPREKPRTIEPAIRAYRIPMEGVSSSVTGGGAAISPDGRMIAFVQEERLWLTDLATGQSVQRMQ